MIKPITPDEVADKHVDFPDAIISIWNNLIEQNFDGKKSVVFQKDLIKEFERLGYSRNKIFDSKWLLADELYKDTGWYVDFHRPVFWDDMVSFGDAYYTFRRK
jgi:phenylalanine-4-hydroxylase